VRSRTLLRIGLLILATAARTAGAQDCPGASIGVESRTEATAGPLITDGYNGGHPATSTASNGLANPGFNVSVSGTHTIDDGYFSSSTHAGGDLAITCCASNSALVRNKGHVTDCLVVGGVGGGGYLHIPIHLTGSALAEWSITPDYTPTPGAVFAGNQFSVGGTVFVGSQGAFCPTISFDINETRDIDQIVELVCPFSFGDSTKLDYRIDANSSLGYSANGSEASNLSATGNLSLLGVLQPAYVTDGFGTLLPTATISASSGFDYLHPVPEPSATAATAAMLATLAARRRFTASR
jgi:hypothetical protein